MHYFVWHFWVVPKRILKQTDTLLQFYSHYFAAGLLFRTLLVPWHLIIDIKKTRGLDIEHEVSKLFFNFISSVIGLILRSAVLVVWVAVCLPTTIIGMIFTLLWVIFFPFSLIFYIGELRKPRVKSSAKRRFVKDHTMTDQGFNIAVEWFERYWRTKNKSSNSEHGLFSIVSPFSSWHYGYTVLLDKYSLDLTDKVNIVENEIIGRDGEVERILTILKREKQPGVLVYGATGSGRHAVIYEVARRLSIDHASIPGKLRYNRLVKLDVPRLSRAGKSADQIHAQLKDLLDEATQAGNIILVLDQIHMVAEFSGVLADYVQKEDVRIIGLTSTDAYHEVLLKNELIQKILEPIEIPPLANKYILQLLQTSSLRYEKKFKTVFPVESLDLIIELGNRSQNNQPDASLDLLEEMALEVRDKQEVKVTPAKIKQVAEIKFKTPLSEIGPQEKAKLRNMEDLLHQHVVDQQMAISQISDALRRARLRLQSENRPLASFLFLGPTGVGKTETAKALAAIYFADVRSHLTRFDMSNFQNKSDSNRLIAELAEQIRKQPYSVLLLDEIEKAHKDLLNIFLSIIDEGYFMDLDGDRVDCRNAFIISTSNAAAEYIRENIDSHGLETEVLNYILKESIFSPEFVNRFDGVVVFKPLGKDELKKIAVMKLKQLNVRLNAEHRDPIDITERLLDKIVEEGYKPEFGAREINRAIERIVTSPLADKLLLN
ncbi:hypothetical protein COW99_02070 [Candidatus Roizmanbacteria bacterium CG22_combo_CG10-13_8_21_14_all_38_20]|uniref:AAA+ ATPase domain-containing protein n=1 Tax=Candidatus Roizmanbacteria bacterium CG22_combo_CG10-13_8_21_14_all_38_20 TaxID=1974862 RepID=A0A2H0BW68_9BACT|nr:ATP-dependent Clp protease ATP-binding subunit [Candidatus Microgenomates bacterium]PIP61789.1 MAG: hypothetical protein COW99_02070 [Candidatus Roizmanbacteria bacterium CG22_combo_CG10-13_8_21_14_all_38_20]PJC31634.1 MAG: hypothetical protein CO050_02380 [Candidatus Roizmanbacteria bacterium CG_4_9_14_0_2_um_filter_38_17]